MDYTAFLRTKQAMVRPVGFDLDPAALHDRLRADQRDVVRWALALGRAALFLDTGLGKTISQLEWARHVAIHTQRPVLVLAPLAVAHQTVKEGRKIDLDVTYVRSQAACGDQGVYVANYEMLDAFDTSIFGGVVLDECFAPDTLIDTPTGPRPIRDIRIGDAILNASGTDTVSDVHRREVPYAIRITLNGRSIISSPNHPYCTQRGWVGASDLRPGDYALATSAAMRLVRGHLHPEVSGAKNAAVLRDILLSEMADASARTPGQGAYARNRRQARHAKGGMVRSGVAQGRSRAGALAPVEPDDQPRIAGESLPPIERDRARTFRAWGQWHGDDLRTARSLGGTWQRLESGVCFVTGATDGGLSDALQARSCAARSTDQYRGGWTLAPQPESPGSEARRPVDGTRVDRLEVLELGHPDLADYRDADGALYFYDLGGTRHPSFSIHGHLVHNSSILKAFSGVTRKRLQASFANTPYRLCCTATPAPNDHMELSNHAEFLGIMTGAEMLARWFINDSMKAENYRLKHHAKADFWRWVTSWAVCATKPSDLGHDDTGFDLPPLHLIPHIVEVDHTRAHADGQLFVNGTHSATGLWKEKRATAADRCALAASLIMQEPDDTWAIWCDTNDEADRLLALLSTAGMSSLVEVRGSDTPAVKERSLSAFSDGEVKAIITKVDIAGYGLNWQHCTRMCFVGVTYSYEKLYQGLRRAWRYGQRKSVTAHLIYAESEGNVMDTIKRKQIEHQAMQQEMARAQQGALNHQGRMALRSSVGAVPIIVPSWIVSEIAA